MTSKKENIKSVEAIPIQSPYHSPLWGPDHTGISTNLSIHSEEEDYFEMRSEKEVRLLLSELFLWLSGMGKYPETLNNIYPAGVITDIQTDTGELKEDKDKKVVQVLRWVLGEI